MKFICNLNMDTIKKHDFVELEYVGRIKDTDHIFDLTSEELAKEKNLYNPNLKYGPVVICVGENNIIKGLDIELEGKSIGKYKIGVSRENGFGKKNPRLIKIVNTNIFLKQNINPFPGLQVNVDEVIGTIRSVSGGRCIIDFNHPLAGRDLEYEVNIIKKVISLNEKMKSLLNFVLYLRDEDFEINIENDVVNIKLKTTEKLPDEIKSEFEKRAKELVKELKGVNFIQ